ncbi:dUTP diphosphatase [Yoonia sp. GPGPB17]|uniref:dUTP diphosphatase n=1 Tax=Yoonia sp. GPGPB17 TaxID=3026147 RepID=UPI0030BB21F2
MPATSISVKILGNAVKQYDDEIGNNHLTLFASMEDDQGIPLPPGGRTAVPSGIALDLPDLYEAVVTPCPSLAEKLGVTVLNNPGTIDPDFKGEIQVLLINLGGEKVTIGRGDKIAELRTRPFVRADFQEVDELSPSVRGSDGLGSTGV